MFVKILSIILSYTIVYGTTEQNREGALNTRGNIFAFELTNNCVGHILSTTLSWWHMFQGPVLCLEILDMSPAVLENPDKLLCWSAHHVILFWNSRAREWGNSLCQRFDSLFL